MINCNNCGAPLPEGAQVCQRCAAAQSPQQPPVQPPVYQQYQPPAPPRAMLPPPQFVRQQRSFCWMDIFTVLGFVAAVVGYFYASVLLLPLGLIASIVGFRSDRNRGLAVAGIVISAIGALIKVMVILSEAAVLPTWFTNGIW